MCKLIDMYIDTIKLVETQHQESKLFLLYLPPFDAKEAPSETWQKQVASAVLDTLGITYTDLVWSQTAGCYCGCCPGFLIRGDSNKKIFVYLSSKINKENPFPTIVRKRGGNYVA